METKAEQTAGMAAGSIAKLTNQDECAKREKTWEELTDMERIARMRRELILMNELVQSQQALIERLMVHQHGPSGEMALPMRYSGRDFEGRARRSGLA